LTKKKDPEISPMNIGIEQQNVEIANLVWNGASTNYQDRIPLATRNNITAVANAITSYAPAMNEFLDALVNRIGLVLIANKMATNKLAIFKRGTLEYGSDIEEVFTDILAAQHFDVAAAETDVFKRVKPDVKTIFHRVNREDFYKVTIEDGQIKRAFLDAGGLGKLVTSIMNAVYSSDNYDEYVLMKELFAQYSALFKKRVIPEVTNEATARDFFRGVKQASTDLTFMSRLNNAQGVMTFTDKSDQVLILHKNVETFLNVDVLSYVFNTSKMDFDTQIVVVDDFGSMADTQGLLVDKNWFMVYDKLFQTTNQNNAQGLYTNYFVHHHQTLSTSQFANAIKFAIA
jgi:hypothetical protein